MQRKKFTAREKAMLVGLFMAKFNKEGMRALEFNTSNEIWNVIGLSLDIQPMSIKNYRDEFDFFCPQSPRKGWQRSPRPNRVSMWEQYGQLSLAEFVDLLKDILYRRMKDPLLEKIAQPQENQSFARRLITGQAAERYFWSEHANFSEFSGLKIKDTTQLGCGFDFRLSKPGVDYGVEVKGISASSGAIMMTEKEYHVASIMRSDYFLFVVKNMQKSPLSQIYRDPVAVGGNLKFSQTERNIVQINWTTTII